jgi:serine/threonine protein kinase
MGALGGDESRLPEQFGKYSLLGHLATGGMAEVYLARQGGLQGFEKIVVIKRVRPEMGDKQTIDLFLDEARLVATLEHPNIAQVYEIGLVGDSYFFVMEYVHGADLRQVLETSIRRERKMSLADAVYIMSHVCSALHYAHEKRDLEGSPLEIIHRDVSPSNVLLSHDGAVKVCDFGIAKAANRSTDTNRGMLKGKFSYMSPEQIRSEELDRRSDIFAIGILLYELTTLSRLFNAPSDFELLRTIVEEPVPPPSTRVPDYPPELERIILKALEKNPAKRYATAQEIQLELEAFAREHKLGMSSVSIARMMGELFEKRIKAWQRSQESGKRLEDHLLETVRRPSGELPVFLPLGSEQDYDVLIDTPLGSGQRERRRSQPIAAVTVEPPKRRANAVWIVLAVLLGVMAGGVTFGGKYLQEAQVKAQAHDLDAAGERIATTFDGVLRSVQMRALGIAGTPVLRTAIETDAATVTDLAQNEVVFAPAKGETIEVFAIAGGKTTSLVRLPKDAPPIPPVQQAQETRFEVAGDRLIVTASAPIQGLKSVAGALAISRGVDLTSIRASVAKLTTRAELAGLSQPFILADDKTSPRAPVVNVQIPLSAEWGVAPLSLAAYPPPVEPMPWIAPVRYACIGGAALFLLLYLVGLRRSRS